MKTPIITYLLVLSIKINSLLWTTVINNFQLNHNIDVLLNGHAAMDTGTNAKIKYSSEIHQRYAKSHVVCNL